MNMRENFCTCLVRSVGADLGMVYIRGIYGRSRWSSIYNLKGGITIKSGEKTPRSRSWYRLNTHNTYQTKDKTESRADLRAHVHAHVAAGWAAPDPTPKSSNVAGSSASTASSSTSSSNVNNALDGSSRPLASSRAPQHLGHGSRRKQSAASAQSTQAQRNPFVAYSICWRLGVPQCACGPR